MYRSIYNIFLVGMLYGISIIAMDGIPASQMTLDTLTKNNARLLRSFVAIELNGKFCPELCMAEKILSAESMNIKHVHNLTKETLDYIHVICGKQTMCRGLKKLIDRSHKVDLLEQSMVSHENLKFVINSYFFDETIKGYITLLHYVLMRAKKVKKYAPFALRHMQLLLNAGANPNAAVENDGARPLHYAFIAEQIDLLCSFGALCNKTDDSGITPLMVHVRDNKVSVVGCLLDYGVNMDVQNDSGWTALHYAALMPHPAMVTKLLVAGANYGLRDNSGHTPFSMVRSEIKQLFEKHLQDCLCFALQTNNSKDVRRLMNKQPWINYYTKDGVRIIDWIEDRGILLLSSVHMFKQKLSDQLCRAHEYRCKELIACGAEVNRVGTKPDRLPLLWALKNDQEDSKIKFLLKNGALVSPKMMELEYLENKPAVERMLKKAYAEQNKSK